MLQIKLAEVIGKGDNVLVKIYTPKKCKIMGMGNNPVDVSASLAANNIVVIYDDIIVAKKQANEEAMANNRSLFTLKEPNTFAVIETRKGVYKPPPLSLMASHSALDKYGPDSSF